MRLALRLAYLGTAFEGWQVQASPSRAARTVQGELEAALGRIYKVPVPVHGAGRTDAGVHANGQVAHADLPAEAPAVPPDGLRRALNGLLSSDVRVESVWVPPDGWHARFSASGKIYVYRLRRGEWLHPHRGQIEALAREPLNVAPMRRAAESLVGRRDFAAFSVSGSDTSGTVRTLHRLSIDESEGGSLLLVTAVGDGFLRGMVRRLVGTLREVGRGRTAPEDVLGRPGPTAEARGLTLERVLYPPEEPGSAGSGEGGERS